MWYDTFWGVIGGLTVAVIVATVVLLCISRKKKPSHDTLGITSLKVYGQMQFFSTTSVYICLWVFLDKFFNVDDGNIGGRIWLPTIIFIVSALFVLAMDLVLNRQFRRKWYKLTAFCTGAVMCLASFVLFGVEGTFWRILNYFCFSIGIGFVFVSLNSLRQELYELFEIVKIESEQVDITVRRTDLLSQITATIVFAVSFAVCRLLPVFGGDFDTLAIICAAAFFVTAMVYSLAFPIDKHFAKKLRIYGKGEDDNINYPLLERQLEEKLTHGKRSVLLGLLKIVIRPFVPAKVRGKNKVDKSGGAVVYVANHYEIYGPVCTILHMPYVRPWIINRMIDEDAVAEQLVTGVNEVLRIFPQKFRAKLPKKIAPLVLKVLSGVDPIPVYRDNSRDVLKTFKLTVEAMQQGDDILIFPEKPEEGKHYAQEGVDAFYSGFADIGRMYYRASGKIAAFYPMYVDKRNREIVIGDGVKYMPDSDKREEKIRITDTLNRQMAYIAEEQAAKYLAKKSKRRKKNNKSSQADTPPDDGSTEE
ncbi:MAG: hypothetical protein NC350_04105 [Corallococcus sp.]|nr:hypothetical protein [Corallococcus sp.]